MNRSKVLLWTADIRCPSLCFCGLDKNISSRVEQTKFIYADMSIKAEFLHLFVFVTIPKRNQGFEENVAIW